MATRRDALKVVGGGVALGLAGFPFVTRGAETVKVGFFGPLTGRLAGLGLDAERGAKQAVAELNDAGGLSGKPVELIVYDDRGKRSEAVSVVRKLIQQDRVTALIDGSLSLTSIAAAPVVNREKTPMVVAYSNAVDVVKDHEYIFRWASVADVQGYVMAHDAIKQNGYKKFAVFVQDEEYGRGIINGAEVGVKEWGGEIVYKQAFSPGEKEFRSFLTRVKNLNVDAVFISGFGPSLVAIGRQGYELGVFPKAQFYGGCDMSEIDWYRGIGEYGEGALATLEFVAAADTERATRLRKVWKREYDAVVTHEAGLTYDASRLLFDAMQRGGTEREDIRAALADTKSFTNMSGVDVGYTELREPMLPISLAQWEQKIFDFAPVRVIDDPALIDPRPWYKYY